MDYNINFSKYAASVVDGALSLAKSFRHEFIMPEHLLMSLLKQERFCNAIRIIDGNVKILGDNLADYVSSFEKVPESVDAEPAPSMLLNQIFLTANDAAIYSGKPSVEITHIVKGLLAVSESFASVALNETICGDEAEFISELMVCYNMLSGESQGQDPFFSEFDDINDLPSDEHQNWTSLVTCINDSLENRNPLIGREDELEKTIRVLCRKEKNNPLHVGEPGVGKTALVYGLAKLIENGMVPDKLKGARIYRLDMGTLLAGTKYRGELEKRVKLIMDGVSKLENAIVYIDEIHNLVGAGATDSGSMDASNMLKPYLEAGNIRFIGSTTYEEHKRYFAKSKGIVRRFTQIDIPEPTIEQSVNILKQLKRYYESFHGVHYLDSAVVLAVSGSATHNNARFLPDKAIDIIDEAGAYRQMHPLPQKRQTIDKALIAEIIAKACKVEAVAMKSDDTEALKTLSNRISSQIFGQNEAISKVTEAVQMAKAGLSDESKPLASLLFVGPTGVGKTEVARVLAKELSIELIRFDMSEYTEKHAVAKLIGSPAGYVGYEDGGLLTDAIRKTPNCVLLLDEIEKAHSDIYNILLQVMDYARLTDNKGNRADFRNVILIMTSNAGAQFASMAKIGFGSTASRGDAMMREVKKTFKPEFLNRLSDTVVFNDMSREMASLILDKKISQLQRQLEMKNVMLSLSTQAKEFILKEGFTPEYGARELDRVIASRLKPVLMREILFGKLKKGGVANVDLSDNSLIVSTANKPSIK